MAIREGRWDCQYCATQGILGRYQACPICSKSRPAGTRFYLPENAEEVTEGDLVAFARRGPDWICEFCGSSNGAERTTCQSCQAERGSAPTQQVKTYQPGQAPQTGDMTLTGSARESTPVGAGSLLDLADWDERIGRLSRRPLLIAGLILLLVCGGFVALTGRQFINREVEVRVAGFEWTRTVEVETYRTVTEEDWTLPAGGRLIRQQEAVHHYDQVLAGYETRSREVPEQVYAGSRTYVCGVRDLGNGFFEDVTCTEPVYETRYRTETYQEPIYNQVPVYQTQYTYDIEKWVVDRVETADGRNRQPAWPAVALSDTVREGQKTETYWVIFNDGEGQSYRMAFPYDAWLQFQEGGRHALVTNGRGEAIELAD